MKTYNLLKSCPKEVQKQITGGRLKGMTDIKPQWRIQKMTEVFGLCGFGWKYFITDVSFKTGAKNEEVVFVSIDLFIKVDGEWSEAIPGSGGSMFIADERNGLYTSDEAIKMATTDALSVAMKQIGMAADIYMGYSDSKYVKAETDEKDAPVKKWPTDKEKEQNLRAAHTLESLAAAWKALSVSERTRLQTFKDERKAQLEKELEEANAAIDALNAKLDA